jgi:hypothetical protein
MDILKWIKEIELEDVDSACRKGMGSGIFVTQCTSAADLKTHSILLFDS